MNKASVEFLANGKGLFEALKIRDKETEEEELIKADGVFIFIGLVPNGGVGDDGRKEDYPH